jgi:hypothetical protein
MRKPGQPSLVCALKDTCSGTGKRSTTNTDVAVTACPCSPRVLPSGPLQKMSMRNGWRRIPSTSVGTLPEHTVTLPGPVNHQLVIPPHLPTALL